MGRIRWYFHREIGDKTMVDEISEIFKKFTDEDNEIVRRFIEMDPDSGRFIFDDVDMGFYESKRN